MYSTLLTFRDKGTLRVVFNSVPNWEDFEELAKYLEYKFRAKILKRIDGPDARRWIVDIDGFTCELIHSDGYGNYLLAPSSEIDDFLLDLSKRLERNFLNTDRRKD